MPILLGYYRDKKGEIVSVNEVAFHQDTDEEIVLIHSNNVVVNYPNKRLAGTTFPKVVAVSRLIFDNQYTYMGEDWHPAGFMEDCVFS